MTLVGLIGAAPRARCGVARGGACARDTRWGGAVVLLDGGSSWSAPGRAALLEPPAAASAAAARYPGNLRQVMDYGTAHNGEGGGPTAVEQRGTYPGWAAKSTTSVAC